MRWRGARGQAHHRVAWPSPWPCHHMVRPGGRPSDAALSPISSPQWEKPKGRISFPRNIMQATTVAVARSGGSRSSSRHPVGKGNPYRRPSTPPWSPLEWSVSSLPLDYGSIAVARWLYPPPCASCLDLVSFPIWSGSSLCNHTCCVCWDPMSIGTMLSWCAELYMFMLSLCYLWSCMLSVASSYLGRVDASDSKREYLCSIVGFMPLVIWGSDRNL
jgi:hypothetical protein